MKQNMKKIFSGIFVLILMVTMLPVGTKASEIEVIDDYTKVPSGIWRETYKKREYGVAGYSGVQGPLSVMRVGHKNGHYVWCLEPTVKIGGNGDYGSSSALWNGLSSSKKMQISRIGNIADSSKSTHMYLAAQKMIWEQMGNKITNTNYSGIDWYTQGVKDKENYIRKILSTYETVPSFNRQTIQMNWNEKEQQYVGFLKDSNGVIGNKFSKINNLVHYGIKVQVFAGTNQLKLTAPKTFTNTNTIQFKPSNTKGLMEWEPSANNGAFRLYGSSKYQDMVNGLSDPTIYSFNAKVNVKIEGKAWLKKQNQHGEHLNGVVFDVYNDINNNKKYDKGDTLNSSYTTAGNGYLETKTLQKGNYVIVERKELDGYEEAKYQEAFSITKKDELISLNASKPVINNRIEGKAWLKKQNQHGTHLNGVVFDVYNDLNNNKIYDNEDSLNSSYTTAGNGYLETKILREGNYVIVERKELEGYEEAKYQEAFSITKKDELISLNASKPVINNRIEGKAKLNKQDQYGMNLEGVEFTLYNDINGNNILDTEDTINSVYITDKNGNIQTNTLFEGNYIIKETKSLLGYETPIYEEAFSITTPNQNINLNNNKPLINYRIEGAVSVEKMDDYGNPLEDVEFTLYPLDEDGNYNINRVSGILITDEFGQARLDKISAGKYIVIETKGIEGYINHKFTEKFEITEDYQEHRLNQGVDVINTKIEGFVEVYKTDDKGNVLNGVEFTVYDDLNQNGKVDVGEEKIETITTDIKGYARTSMLAGGYYVIKETKGIEGYINLGLEHEFIINEETSMENDKLVATFKVTNNKIEVLVTTGIVVKSGIILIAILTGFVLVSTLDRKFKNKKKIT